MYQINNNIKTDWKNIISQEMSKDYFKNIIDKLLNTNSIIFPEEKYLFNAFNFFNIKDTKVIILGQDPYFSENQAHGLSFSVIGDKNTKTLINIFKELKNDLGIIRNNINLSDWAKQGVLLLNTTLTVEKGLANSHNKYGWKTFTNNILKYINENLDNIIFVLWGNDAKKYESIIDVNKHHIISSSHPSPLGSYKGFNGSKPFSKINYILNNKNNYNINW